MFRQSKFIQFCRDAITAQTDECILWPWSRDSGGYGHVRVNRRLQKTHRIVCEAVHGPPEGEKSLACHLCRNRHCINPRHLKWGTAKDNMDDRDRDGTTAAGARSGRARLTIEQVSQAREMTLRGLSTPSIARYFGVTSATVWKAINGFSWKEVVATPPVRTSIPRGEKNYKSKLTSEQVREIRRLFNDGVPKYRLAKQFNVARTTIGSIIRRKIWKHIV